MLGSEGVPSLSTYTVMVAFVLRYFYFDHTFFLICATFGIEAIFIE